MSRKSSFTVKEKVEVCTDMRRSKMTNILFQMLNEGSITRADLSEFRRDLQDTVDFLYGR